MMTRPFIILLAGTLLSTAVANADRRRRSSDDEEEDRAPTRSAKRSIGGEDRRRAAKAVEEDDQEDDDRPKKKKEKKPEVADVETEQVDPDGPEAKGIIGIGLDELINVTVTHSPNLARAKLQRTAARGDAGAARIDQAWKINAEGKYTRRGVGGDTDVQLGTTVDEQNIDATLSIGRNLPTGGKVEAKVAFNRNEKELAISKNVLQDLLGTENPAAKQALEEFSTAHQVYGILSFTQPLLRGMGSDVALAKEHKSDLIASQATLNAQFEAEKSILEIITLFWETAVAADELAVRNQALDMATRQEKFTRDSIRAGAAAQNALSPVLFEIASRDDARLVAQINLDKKSLELRRKAGLNLADRTLVVKPQQALEITDDRDFEVNEMISRSHKSNRRMVILALKRREADVDVKVANNAMLPQVDVNLSAGLVGTGRSTDEAFQHASGADGFQLMASLSVQFEISGAAKDGHRAAIARRTTVDVDRIELEREIEAEVVAAVAKVNAARKRVALAEQAIALAEDNLKAERANFENQRSNNFEVMKRQTELVESMLRRTRAVADFHVAVATLQFQSGTLLEDYRINVRPVAE